MTPPGLLYKMLQKFTRIFIIPVWLFILPATAAFASNDVFIVSSPDNRAMHAIATHISKKLLSQNINSALLDPDKSSLSILEKADLIIVMGKRAIKSAIEKAGSKPVLGITTSALPQTPGLSQLVIQQPLCRHFRLIRSLSDEIRTVSVISRNQNIAKKLEQCAKQNNLQLKLAIKREHESLASTVSKALESDVILALPDKSIYNANTVRNILLRSYRKRIPVIGFSRAFVNAGALAALHSDPEHIAEQVVILVKQYFELGKLPAAPTYLDHYEVLINHRVSDSLELDLPPEQAIMERLKADRAK